MTNTRLILEGPDGIGKTTQTRIISKILSMSHEEFNKGHENTLKFWSGKVKQQTDLGIIWSRSFLSERLYAPIFNREPRLTVEEEEYLVYLARKHGYQIVVFMPLAVDTYKTRLLQRGDYPEVIQNIDTILEGYRELIKKYKLKEVLI